MLYTDVDRDGTERGPNLEDTGRLARAAGLPVGPGKVLSSLVRQQPAAAAP